MSFFDGLINFGVGGDSSFRGETVQKSGVTGHETRDDALIAANATIEELRSRVLQLERERDDALFLEEFGIYEPTYTFANATGYKDALRCCRDSQKAWVRRFSDSLKKSDWTVNGSVREGRKMVGDFGRLLIRAYNDECNALIGNVTYRNIDATVSKILSVAEQISKFGRVIGIQIDSSYADLKIEEARLAYDYAQFKQVEKERIREQKALEREERKVQAEMEARRKDLERERKKYVTEKERLRKQLSEGVASGKDMHATKQKLASLDDTLNDIDESLADVDYRMANNRAGYVYVISNIGSFGPGVYKIGMTRRLDPYERVRELSGASVPFAFDVHAMIFTDDAPGLEAALHREFADRKVNLVNGRKEFFAVSLDEIRSVIVSNYDGSVEFVDSPDADQWRQSRSMRHKQNRNIRLDLVRRK